MGLRRAGPGQSQRLAQPCASGMHVWIPALPHCETEWDVRRTPVDWTEMQGNSRRLPCMGRGAVESTEIEADWLRSGTLRGWGSSWLGVPLACPKCFPHSG